MRSLVALERASLPLAVGTGTASTSALHSEVRMSPSSTVERKLLKVCASEGLRRDISLLTLRTRPA